MVLPPPAARARRTQSHPNPARVQVAHVRIAAIDVLSSLEPTALLLAQHAAAIEQLALRDEVMDVRQARLQPRCDDSCATP